MRNTAAPDWFVNGQTSASSVRLKVPRAELTALSTRQGPLSHQKTLPPSGLNAEGAACPFRVEVAKSA
jgi:hypothetical protein